MGVATLSWREDAAASAYRVHVRPLGGSLVADLLVRPASAAIAAGMVLLCHKVSSSSRSRMQHGHRGKV